MKKPADLNRSMDGKAISTEGDDLCEDDMDEDVQVVEDQVAMTGRVFSPGRRKGANSSNHRTSRQKRL